MDQSCLCHVVGRVWTYTAHVFQSSGPFLLKFSCRWSTMDWVALVCKTIPKLELLRSSIRIRSVCVSGLGELSVAFSDGASIAIIP